MQKLVYTLTAFLLTGSQKNIQTVHRRAENPLHLASSFMLHGVFKYLNPLLYRLVSKWKTLQSIIEWKTTIFSFDKGRGIMDAFENVVLVQAFV